jgi:energy-coupling factor transporter transmembrane protein EcfT
MDPQYSVLLGNDNKGTCGESIKSNNDKTKLAIAIVVPVVVVLALLVALVIAFRNKYIFWCFVCFVSYVSFSFVSFHFVSFRCILFLFLFLFFCVQGGRREEKFIIIYRIKTKLQTKRNRSPSELKSLDTQELEIERRGDMETHTAAGHYVVKM